MSSRLDSCRNEFSSVLALAKIIKANPWLVKQLANGACRERGRTLAERETFELARGIGLNRQFSLTEVLGLMAEVSDGLAGTDGLLIAPPKLLNALPTGYRIKTIGVFLEEILRKATKEVLLLAPFWEKATLLDLLRCIKSEAGKISLTLLLVEIGERRLSMETFVNDLRSIRPLGRIRIFIHRPTRTGLSKYPHAKCLVVDRCHAYLGSANFTSAGLLGHVEIGAGLGFEESKVLGSVLQYLWAKTDIFFLAWDSSSQMKSLS